PEIVETDSGTQAVFEVRISEPSTSTLNFAYTTADGTALAGEDYTATSGTVTFAPGQTVASVTVDITGDTDIETNEVFSLVVTPNAAIANGVDDAAGIATIIDDDTDTGLPVISISATEADEGDLAVFTVTLSEPSPFADVTVAFATRADGTSIEGTDHVRTTGTLTIPAGETVGTISIDTDPGFSSDGSNEADENFTLVLSDPTGAVLAGGEQTLTATGVILDNDGTDNDRALFVSDPEIVETDSGTQAVFEVRISEPSTSTLNFAYTTADGTALAGEDYTAASGTVTFAPGQTVASVTVDITGDTDIETNEVFSLVVTPNAAIANGVDDAAGQATIANDDFPIPPDAQDDAGSQFETKENTAFITGNVLDNDVDPDSDVLSVSAVDLAGTLGVVTDLGDGTFSYDPNGAFDSLTEGEVGIDTFSYAVTDADGGTDTATVEIRVLGIPDPIVGTSNPETLVGSNGDNLITALAGDDTIDAGRGDDTIDAGDGADDVRAGVGDDSVDGGSGDDFLRGGRGEDTLNGGAGEDRISGQRNADTIDGGAGDDNLRGGGGNDSIDGGAGNDFIKGGTRADVLNGGEGNDRIFANSFADILNGDAGNDLLNAGGDNDTLNGGTGNDTLRGGGGEDTFIFETGMGADVVLDFQDDTDTLQISTALTSGLSNAAVVVDTFADVVNGNTVFDFGGGNTITLIGVLDETVVVDDITFV
ncbi:MAG: Calx-beta domain-containing protein, partial [Pseudomonadota bacterium]